GQQTQIEKHRALAEASTKKCEGLQLQVSALKKVTQEQAAANQGALELRLNRALEEVERTKTQLSKMKQIHQMHVEASRLLSFTEEEFKKALNKGKS
uniref:Uncharacterized protein n=1 Tax=Cynoglossus semilaevis TaxID=244447 RepID=A0A3P8WT01_CYNSE